MVELSKEQDLETLRQISVLLDRENQRLITKTLELTAEVARLQGVPNPEQLQLAVLQDLQQRRAQLLQRPTPPTADAPAPRNALRSRGTVHVGNRRSRSSRFGTNSRPRIDSAPRVAVS